MCAIAGIIRFSGAANEKEISEMNDRMTRRGPDDSGVFVKGGVALSHRRLSIIDIETGHQPLTVDDGNVVIVYNGEIYNFQELREELEQRERTYLSPFAVCSADTKGRERPMEACPLRSSLSSTTSSCIRLAV